VSGFLLVNHVRCSDFHGSLKILRKRKKNVNHGMFFTLGSDWGNCSSRTYWTLSHRCVVCLNGGLVRWLWTLCLTVKLDSFYFCCLCNLRRDTLLDYFCYFKYREMYINIFFCHFSIISGINFYQIFMSSRIPNKYVTAKYMKQLSCLIWRQCMFILSSFIFYYSF